MTYSASDLEVLKGLDPVRKRPGMYTETSRPNHLAQEVIDNSVDEAINGFAGDVVVTYHEDESISVEDNGRGIPIDLHKEEKKPGYEVILGTLHAGGKFSGNNYSYSGGLHGVGVSVVNALSKRLELTIWRDGKRVTALFESGDMKKDKKERSDEGKSGTRLRFWPDEQFFDSPRFNIPSIINLLKSKAVLCKGLRVKFINEQSGSEDNWCYENGLHDYFLEQQEQAESPTPEFGWSIHAEWDGGECDTVFSFSEEAAGIVSDSFANLIPTPQGGTHASAVKSGIAQAIRKHAEVRSLLPKNTTLTQDDITYSLNSIISIKVRDPQFAGQTKEKLRNREFVSELSAQARDQLETLLNADLECADKVVGIAIARALLRSKESKKVVRKKATSGLSLPSKLADCTQASAEAAELFLVEGDSAGGSAKQARDRRFQAIMPLRGKIQNTWEVESGSIFSSQEISNIATAVGMDPNSEDMSGLRYGKVCLLADADSDGLHIASLLCALFVRHFEPFVRSGHLYIAIPPLYRIDLGKEVHYALTEADKPKILSRLSNKKGTPNVQRFKGLGEMNPDQLAETVMSPETRNLLQVTIEDVDELKRHMGMLFEKKKAPLRRQWIEAKGNQTTLASD